MHLYVIQSSYQISNKNEVLPQGTFELPWEFSKLPLLFWLCLEMLQQYSLQG